MLNFIVNPVAGKNLASTNIKLVSKYLKKEKIPYLVYFSEKETDIENIVSTLYKNGEKEFVLVGGDGTIHKFINAIPELSKINFGIIPSGINNNFAKMLALEFNPITAIKNILATRIENFDYIKCNNISVCNCLSFGAIETIKYDIYKNSNKKRPSLFNYAKSIKEFQPIQINFMGNELKDKNIFIKEFYVCNGTHKGQSHISPLSNPQDGLCNVIAVTQKEGNNKITEFLKIRNGKHIYNTENKTYWASEFTMTSSIIPIKAEIDGEMYELEQICIKVVQGGLNICI